MKPIYIILIIIILAVLGVSVWALRASKTTEMPLSVLEKKGPEQKTVVAGGKFYINEEEGITFYYPKEWIIQYEYMDYGRAACDDPEYRDSSCIKTLRLSLGAPGKGGVEFGGRQCLSMAKLAKDYQVCYTAKLPFEPFFSDDEKRLQYADLDTQKGIKMIRKTFKFLE